MTDERVRFKAAIWELATQGVCKQGMSACGRACQRLSQMDGHCEPEAFAEFILELKSDLEDVVGLLEGIVQGIME